MKKTRFARIFLALSYVFGLSYVAPKIVMSDATNASDWVSRASGAETVTNVTNGVQINNLSEWGRRVGTVSPIDLDGLQFDFTLTNASSGQSVGFYFSSVSTARYNPLDGDSNDVLTFSLNTKYQSYGQTRFAIFKTHDINNGAYRNLATCDTSFAYTGFGGPAKDGTLVLNHQASQSIRVRLDKVDYTFYKVTFTSLNEGALWSGHYNQTGDSLYTYIKLTALEPSSSGMAYMFVYGFSDNGNTPIPQVKNMRTTKHVTFNPNNGGDATTTEVTKGSTIPQPSTPTKEGYSFGGWYSDSGFTNKFDFSTPITSDITLYAKWNEKDHNPPVINTSITQINAYVGNKPMESFTANDAVDGKVPVEYSYSSGALNSDGTLVTGTHTCTLTARDNSGNSTNHTITYHVSEKPAGYSVSHPVFINSSGCDVLLSKSAYYKDDSVSFSITNTSSAVNIEIKDSDNNLIPYTGTNPYSFKMVDSAVTISAINSASSYVSLSSLTADSPYIYYLGRHKMKNNGMFLSYSNSGFLLEIEVTSASNSITANITGTSSVSGESAQYCQTFVDTTRVNRVTVPDGTSGVVVASNLGVGYHVLEFKRCNEAQFANMIVNSISLSGIKVKKHVETRKLIEVYGDSITCGYGTLSASSSESFKLSTEDSTLAYSQLIADRLGYRNSTISFSGIGLYLSWTESPINMITLYKQLDGVNYNMRKDTPDIVIINLGTNDNAKYQTLTTETDRANFKEGFKQNLKKMISTILCNNINSKIIFCYNMMTTLDSGLHYSVDGAISESKSSFGVNYIYKLQFTPNQGAADGHPSAAAHAESANKLYNFIVDNGLN